MTTTAAVPAMMTTPELELPCYIFLLSAAVDYGRHPPAPARRQLQPSSPCAPTTTRTAGPGVRTGLCSGGGIDAAGADDAAAAEGDADEADALSLSRVEQLEVHTVHCNVFVAVCSCSRLVHQLMTGRGKTGKVNDLKRQQTLRFPMSM